MNPNELNKLLGNIDIYLLDQILKERFSKEMRILDAGCGEGRNSIYFLNQGYQIFGVDQEDLAIQYLRYVAKSINTDYDLHRFQAGKIQELAFHDGAFDAVICSAVLHFAESGEDFYKMISEIQRVLKTGGIFWFRMCTAFSDILSQSKALGNDRYLLPDESERFVLTPDDLKKLLSLGFETLEVPKTVLVPEQREMGVFLLRKIG